MTDTTTERHPFLASFSGLEQELASRGPDWVRRLRRAGLARFEQVGFPSTRQEEWRNTNVSPLLRSDLRPPAAIDAPDVSSLPAVARMNLAGPRLFFLDGRYVPALSSAEGLPEGVWMGSLARALDTVPDRVRPLVLARDPEHGPGFVALNQAYLDDGAVVLIPDGADVATPIQLLFASSGGAEPWASQPRTLVSAGAGSRARIVEAYFGLADGTYLTNSVSDVILEDNASIEHYRVQMESEAAFHIANACSRQGRDSRYTTCNIQLGGRLARMDAGAVLDGEGAWCELNGLYLTRGTQHVDNQTVLDHAQPHGDSREMYKGILAGDSRTVFNGRIVVRPGAQKTDSKQSNPNLLLSEGAVASTRPQLEIYADDVKCTHGATIGRLDEEALFYLQSRAVRREDARRLLIRAFAGEVLDTIDIEPLRTLLEQEIDSRLPQTAGQARKE